MTKAINIIGILLWVYATLIAEKKKGTLALIAVALMCVQ